MSGGGLAKTSDGSLALVLGADGSVTASSGLRVPSGSLTPDKLKLRSVREVFASSGWTFAGNVNSRDVTRSASGDDSVFDEAEFLRNGIEDSGPAAYRRVTTLPALAGQWRLSGNFLEVYHASSFNGSGDTFSVKYHVVAAS